MLIDKVDQWSLGWERENRSGCSGKVFYRVLKMSWSKQWSFHNPVNISETTELHTLKLVLWNMNCLQ